MTMTIYKDEALTEEERQLVETFNDVVVGATGSTSLIWVVAEDERNRRYLQLRRYSNMADCFVELIPDELRRMDANTLTRIIVGGERRCKIDVWLQDESTSAERLIKSDDSN